MAVERVDLFALERHAGPYEKWPLRTRLLVRGEPSATQVPGYELLHQFRTPQGFLLVTDWDCPFEEGTNFILLEQATLRILARRELAVPYGSFLLDRFEWIDDQSARVTFYEDDHWLLTLRPKAAPLFSSRLRLRRM